MFKDGSALRSYRVSVGLSQARIAEATGIPQYLLSAYELGKGTLPSGARDELFKILGDGELSSRLSARKKRYRPHAYSERRHDAERVARYRPSHGNGRYLKALASVASTSQRTTFTGLSLFSGCGGFSLGLRASGCDIKGFVEIDDELSKIYRANFPTAERIGGCIQGVTDAQLDDFTSRQGSIDVLLGGPPCQGFSLAGKRQVDDPRNELFRDYIRVVDKLRPKVAVLENVRLLTSMRLKSGALAKDEITREFEKRGYRVALFSINAKDYGVPQHRERVVFMAVAEPGISPSVPQPTHGEVAELFSSREPYLTFADACSDLTFLESGENDPLDPLHAAVKHPDHVLDWLWDVEEGHSAHDNDDPALRPPSGYNTTYKRQVWSEPGATVQTTFGMISGCRNVHPIATRSLTVREAARLQTFPDNFEFFGSLNTIRTGIGNAVPPLLAYAIGSHIRANILDLVEVARL